MTQRRNRLRHPRWLHSGPRLGYSIAAIAFFGNAFCFPLRAYGVSVALVFLGILGLAIADLRGLACLAFPAVSLAGEAVSLGYIESGAFISEQRRAGFNVGATPLFGVYAIAFLAFAHFCLTWLASRTTWRKRAVPQVQLLQLLVALSAFVGVIYAIIFLRFGTGLGFRTRFDWIGTLPPLVARLHLLLRTIVIPVTFALLGIYGSLFGVRRSWRWLTFTILPIAALVGMGDKFSSFILVICMLVTGVGIGGFIQGRSIRIRRGYVLVGLGLAVLLLISLVAGYSRQAVGNPFQAILNRMALQGHVWFGIFERFHGNPSVPIGPLLGPNSIDAPAGLDLLSYYVADGVYVYRRIGQGLTFTMGGPPGVLGVFGAWGGLIVYTLLGLLYVAVIGLVLYLWQRRLLLGIPFALGLYVLVNVATQMGFWDALYGTAAFTCYAAILTAVVVTEVRRARKRKDASVPTST